MSATRSALTTSVTGSTRSSRAVSSGSARSSRTDARSSQPSPPASRVAMNAMNATKLRVLTVLCASILVAACDETPSKQQHGSLELTTSSAVTEKGFTTADGWNVTFKHFFVHVSAVTVAGLDSVVTASATPQIIDQVVPGPKTLLSATVRAARPWEDVSFEVGPAAVVDDVGPTFAPPVTQADVDRMVKDGLSFYVEGTATRAAVTKSFAWGFATDTLHQQCTGDLNGASVPGLLVPPDGVDAADI